MTEGAAGVVVTGLVRHFGEVQALRGVDFEVSPGEIFGLLGPNGAGKTTALRILATLLRPTSGAVRVAGRDPVTEPLEVRRRIGYLTGDTGLYHRLTPPELLRYFGRLHGMAPTALAARVDALVGELGITDYAKQRCGTLSTGQKQRVSIARALLHDPPVLVFDEPTSGLDVLAAQGVLHALRRERERGKAIVFSSHVFSEVELVCDRVAFLHRGSILDTGTIAEVLERADAPNLARALLLHIARTDPDAARAIDEGAAWTPS